MSFNAKSVIKSLVARGLVENGCVRFTLVVDASTDVVELSQSGSHAPGAAGDGIADSLRSGLDKPERVKLDEKAADDRAKRKAASRAKKAAAPAEKAAAPAEKPTDTTPERQHSALRPGK